MKKQIRVIALCIIVSMVSCHFFFRQARAAQPRSQDRDEDLYKHVELFADALTIVQADYVEDIESKKLVYGALEGMLSSLDGYSQFLDPESFKEMEIETRGEFGGLGIEIGMRDGVLTVIAPIDGTPADKAGLKAGDKIVRIDGESTRGVSLTDAVKKLRGKPKTKVELTVLREDEEKLLNFTIERDVIALKSIKIAKLIEKDIGYIKLVEFQKNSASELENALQALMKQGMGGLVLDVRNNPGGLLDVAYAVSDKFLPKGTVIVSLKGRSSKQDKIYKASGKGNYTTFPIVVLANEGSASASEIVAGAIQDNKRGIILGTKTFGKGSVQTVIPLKDNSAVRLTTAAYYTPSGTCIREKGISPDVEVKLQKTEKPQKKSDIFDKVEEKPEEEEEYALYDNQLQAAIDMLRGILLYDNKRA